MVMGEIQELVESDQEYDETIDVEDAKIISFDVNALRHAVKGADDPEKFIRTAIPYNMCFKMIKSDSRLVKSILFSYGFIQCSSKNSNFNLCWSNTHLNPHVMRVLKPHQRVNHFPRSFMITKKDQLHNHLSRARVYYGNNVFDFIPESYCTPIGVDKRERMKKMLKSNSSIFIVKPSNSSRGRGISFINQAEQVDEIQDSDNVVISRYINRPYLIQNKKSDLRIYVAVTSFYPLIAYMYTDGLTRFAVDDYSDDVTGISAQAQLTNYSLHKTNEKFVKNDRVDCESIGNKWTLGAMLRHMKELGVDTELLMLRIEDVVIKTLLSIQKLVGASSRKLKLHPNTCFELFGFDILVDDDLKPWLLEVNLSPSLNCDAALDSILKTNLIATTLNLARIPLVADKNTLNRAFIMSRFSPSLDDLSNGVSSTARISNKKQSASTSPATVDSGYDTRSLTSDSSSYTKLDRQIYSRVSPPRKCTSLKTVKQRRAQQQAKASPKKMLETYTARLEVLVKKVKDEEERLGDFIRIFPRPESRQIYGQMCEDAGPEQWDSQLSNVLFGNLTQVNQRDYEAFHNQMMDATQHKSRESLSECTVDLLKSAFETADKYSVPFYENDTDPFPQMLPKLRFGLRKRTLSAIDFDARRKAEIISKRECGSLDADDLAELKQQLYEEFKKSDGRPKLVA